MELNTFLGFDASKYRARNQTQQVLTQIWVLCSILFIANNSDLKKKFPTYFCHNKNTRECKAKRETFLRKNKGKNTKMLLTKGLSI